MLIIRKNMRPDPPCGNGHSVYKEYCFPPTNGANHAAEMKAELRSKYIKRA